MLLCPLLALCIIPYYPVSAQPVEPETSATNTAPSVTSSSPGHNLDAGNLGSTIGGEQGIYSDPIESVQTIFVSQSGASAAAIAVVLIVLVFAMLRQSRKRNCLYHNRELGEIVSSLPYRKRNVNIETASVNSSEFDVSI
jgi:hypothetical protein